jgi:amino acid transporter
VFQVFTILLLVIVVLSGASKLNTAEYVFFGYNNDTGFSKYGYVLVLSLLLPLFAFSGYDGPAHMAEETIGSRQAAPMGIVYTVMATGISGFVLLVALLFAMQDIKGAIASKSGNAAIEIIAQTGGQGLACTFCWLLVINIFFGGVSSVAVTSRILFALCRDKASAFASSVGTVHPLLHTPVNAVIVLFVLQSALLLIPLSNYGGSEAFYTILSICVVGLQISYLIPIALKVYSFHLSDGMVARLEGSQMSLGFLSYPLGVLSSIWLFFTTLLLLLPTTYPITAVSMNYACVAVAATILLGWLNWELNSKYVFVGPPRLFDAFEDESTGETEPLINRRRL